MHKIFDIYIRIALTFIKWASYVLWAIIFYNIFIA